MGVTVIIECRKKLAVKMRLKVIKNDFKDVTMCMLCAPLLKRTSAVFERHLSSLSRKRVKKNFLKPKSESESVPSPIAGRILKS